MGKITFFLGLQVTQKDDRIFISQDNYVDEILKKFGFSTMKTASTPIETSKPLLKNAEAKYVDVHLYRSMIGSLMCLTSSRPNIMFVVCACARFQVTPKVSHLHAVKRIFRYLKGQPKLGLWYPKDSPFDLEAYFDSDYAGASLDRESITGGCQFLGSRLISCSGLVATRQSDCPMGSADTSPMDGKEGDRHVDYVEELSNKKMLKSLEGRVKFLMYPRFVQVFLDKQVEGMTKHKEIYVTPSHTKKVFANMKREGKGFSGRVTPLFETMMVQAPEELDTEVPQPSSSIEPITDEASNEAHVPVHSNYPLLSDEGLGAQKDASKQGRKIADLSTAEVTTAIATTKTVDELTLAQTLIEIKAAKPKAVTTRCSTTTMAITRSNFEEIQMLFDNTMKWVDSFVPMNTEVMEGSKSQAEIDENVEAKVDDEAEMKKLMEIVPDDEVAIDAIPLATKSLIIIDWKIIKEGKMGYFQIIRVDGSSRRYSSMIRMLQNIDKEDLEILWKLVKAKHGNTRPEEAYERVLWGI
ncbi:hypothetical protein Tco_0798915 [Tanacetum coccineum]